ncbi:kinase-like domain-containing protein [Suillus ampliporus]|nr:kinase-like domain-containing protein [Suillus ampliporus]
MQWEVDVQPCSSQAMLLDTSSSSSATVRHRHGSPSRLTAQHRRHPYMIRDEEPPAREPPTLQELIQRMEHLRSVMNNIGQSVQTILAQTGSFPDDASTVGLGGMRAGLCNDKTLCLRAHKASQTLQRISNPHDMLESNIAHLNIMATTGRPSVMQGGGAPQQPWLQSAWPTPSFGTNPGVSNPSTTDERRFTGPLTHPSFPLTASTSTSSTRLISPIPIPDLTRLITRCSQDPVSGGTYGNIYKCIYHGPDSDIEVAVKAIRPQFFNAEVFRRELGIWKRLRHSNILTFMGTTSDFGPSVALVAPWIANGTLTSFLKHNNETLALLDRLHLLHDVAAGLDYLHTFSLTEGGHTDFNPVVHGDLTGTNVLVDRDRKAFLADFGLSGTLKQLTGMTYLAKMSCRPGAVRWAAPELLTEEESASTVTTQSDIYSFGSILLQVSTGNVPWPHLTREAAILRKVMFEREMHPRPDDVCVTDQHWNFMTRCWSIIPIDRPSAEEALHFVDRELRLLRLNGGFLWDTSAFNDHGSPCSSFSSAPSLFYAPSPTYPHARREHFPAPPQDYTAVSIAGPSEINSLQWDTLIPGFEWMNQIH